MEIVDSLHRICRESNGAGLAANQISVTQRVFVTQYGIDKTYINPLIEGYGLQTREMESCLSFPGFSEQIRRYSKVKGTAFDIHGEQFYFEVKDFEARLLQHENDHLDGLMFFDHLKPWKRSRLIFEFNRRQGLL